MRASRFKLAILRWLLRSKPIYDVCCALRGPDQFHDHNNTQADQFGRLKVATTAVVRSKLDITNKRKGLEALYLTTWDNYYAAEARVNLHPVGSEHFLGHQRDAFTALGLMWPKPNGTVEP